MTKPSFASHRARLVGPAVAEQIIADIIEMGWPIGQIVGSEAELLERYGISRAVFREAIRLVEHQRVARMRRGHGGGLVVEEPDIDAVVNAVIFHLLRVDATLGEVVDTRGVLEELVAETAAQRITEADIGSVREALATESADAWINERPLHTLLAALTGNPVLDLFVDILTRIGEFFYAREPEALSIELRRQVGHAHAQIAKAVLAKNPGLARVRMRHHLLAEAEFIRAHGNTLQRLPAAAALQGVEGNKRAENLARRIFADILETDLVTGNFVGSEATLMREHAASRAVLREAVRILDYHQIASMRRGPDGGLFVVDPDPAAVADIIAIYLRRRGVTSEHVVEMLSSLELAIVERAADRLSGPDADAVAADLRNYLDTGMTGGRPCTGVDWHLMLAALTGNTTLELVHRVVMRLGWLFFSRIAEADPDVRRMSEASDVESAHHDVVDALLLGDKELAMMRYATSHVRSTGSPATHSR